MYFFDDERHKLPHIHAKYQGQDAVFSIKDGALLAGDIPNAKIKLVQAWIEIHRINGRLGSSSKWRAYIPY